MSSILTSNGIVCNDFETSSFSITSDERCKQNILYNSISSKLLDNINLVTFDYKKHEGNHIGFIAQDIEQYYPQLIKKDENGQLSVKYLEIIPLLLDYSQELKKDLLKLEEKVNNL